MNEDYLNVVFGDREGIVCLAFGRDPYRNEHGRYEHRQWDEVRYRWPDERDEMVRAVTKEISSGEPVDVYICPALRNKGARGRRKGDALPLQTLWGDLDCDPADPHLFDRLDGLVVASGQPGHRHLYVPLDHPVDLGTHRLLNKALADRLGADSKWQDNSLLRLPGTWNHKPAFPPDGDPADQAVLVRIESVGGRVWSAAELADELGVDLTQPAAGPSSRVLPLVTAEQVPAVLPEVVRRALDDPDTTDRSEAIARVVGACVRAGFTAGQALTVVSGYAPAVRYKSRSHMAEDVARLHGKYATPGTTLSSITRSAGGPGLSTSTSSPSRLPVLPDEFWTAREAHKKIRTAAHSRLASADLVLHAVLAKIAAMRSPELWFDSGRGKASLNYFTATVGVSGIGKTTGATAVDDHLLPLPAYLAKPLDGASPDPFHDGLPLGSGEGVAEAYMGQTEIEVGVTKKGEPITRNLRTMVRHNVFVTVDEGETFTRIGERSGATVGATLRSAWVGATIGQANGREDTTRIVKAYSYSLGMLVGFQPHTALPLLTDTATGTAQRFTWVSAADPNLPDDPVEHPGPINLPVLGGGGEFKEAATGTITFPDQIKADLRSEHIAKVRGELVVDEHNSQAPLMRCKLAALLALVDNRIEVNEEDWQLATMLWDTSCAVRDTVTEQAAQEKARQSEIVAEARVRLAERTAAAVDGVAAKLDRLAATLAERVVEAGGMKRGEARGGLAGRDRHLYEQVVERAVAQGLLRLADGGGLLPSMRAA